MPRGRFTQVPDDVQHEIVLKFQAGISATNLAKEYGLTRAIVYGALRRNGLRPMDNYAASRQSKLDPDIVATDYSAGMSLNAIARKYGASYAATRNALKRSPVEPRPCTIVIDKNVEPIIDAYKNGESQDSIAKRLGKSQGWVSNRLKRAGVETDHWRSRENHGAWKGGRHLSGDGYWLVLLPQDDPLFSMVNCQGYVFEHRLVMARHLGRPLEPNETVHHKNGKRDDNRIDNLELWTGKHGKGIRHHCRSCGSCDIEEI